MKANEASEKIYRSTTYLDNDKGKTLWKTKPIAGAENIEYTRTDAFIDKACAFFEENIEEENCKIGSSEWTELRAEYKSLDSFIRAFVEYMKGE